MKKTLLVTAILALAIGATACSKKADTETTAATTEATTEAVTEATTEETTEEEVEEDYMSGIITAVDGDILTVKNDDDSTEKKYDISKAEVNNEFPLSVGDWLDITFPAETTEDPVPVIAVEVLESVIAQTTDPSVEGKVVDATMNTITIEVDGEKYSLGRANAYVVAKDGITVDKNATVTYLGDLDDEPMALKIVMEDSYDTPEAEINAFIGDVVQIGEEGDNIVLESANGDFFTFVSSDIDFSAYEEGQTVEVQYNGSTGAKEIEAVKVTVK